MNVFRKNVIWTLLKLKIQTFRDFCPFIDKQPLTENARQVGEFGI